MTIKEQAVFYHAGCPICVEAEQKIATSLDPTRFDLEIVHLGESRNRLDEAEARGVKSVPALVLETGAFHINFGASLADVRGD